MRHRDYNQLWTRSRIDYYVILPMQINAIVEIVEEYVIVGVFFAGRDEVVTRETCIAYCLKGDRKGIDQSRSNRDQWWAISPN